jgi:hypothetical protein
LVIEVVVEVVVVVVHSSENISSCSMAPYGSCRRSREAEEVAERDQVLARVLVRFEEGARLVRGRAARDQRRLAQRNFRIVRGLVVIAKVLLRQRVNRCIEIVAAAGFRSSRRRFLRNFLLFRFVLIQTVSKRIISVSKRINSSVVEIVLFLFLLKGHSGSDSQMSQQGGHRFERSQNLLARASVNQF